jgi:DNA repair exonuclease SbcCD ATPase subunit
MMRSNPEVEPPADVDDDVYKPVDVEADGNDDPFGFAQPAENNAATNAETIQSVDPLPTFGLDNTPPAESSIVPPLPLIVDTQVQESEQQPQSVSSSIVEEEPSATIETSPIAPVIEHRQETEPSEKMISASVLDRFTDQMHRLEENHHNEILDLQRQHEQQLEDLRNSITHDQCEAQRTELERNFLNRLKEKDEQLQEIMRINEGMELKLDVLKREVTGTKKLLEERESAIGSSSVAHDRAKQLLEEKLRKLEENAGTTQADVVQLQAQLKQAQEELEESNEAYAALKSRVKTVATELKERRGECRTLAVANVELTEVNEQLTTKLAGLQAQLDDRDRSEG